MSVRNKHLNKRFFPIASNEETSIIDHSRCANGRRLKNLLGTIETLPSIECGSESSHYEENDLIHRPCISTMVPINFPTRKKTLRQSEVKFR